MQMFEMRLCLSLFTAFLSIHICITLGFVIIYISRWAEVRLPFIRCFIALAVSVVAISFDVGQHKLHFALFDACRFVIISTFNLIFPFSYNISQKCAFIIFILSGCLCLLFWISFPNDTWWTNNTITLLLFMLTQIRYFCCTNYTFEAEHPFIRDQWSVSHQCMM